MDINRYIKRIDSLFTSPERLSSERQWSELAEFLLNNQAGLSSQTAPSFRAGQKTTQRVFASEPMQFVQQLAAALQSLLTNPATIWSKLREERDELNDNAEVNEFLEKANKTIHRKLQESNFYPEIGKAYQSYVALANTVLLQEEKDYNENSRDFSGFKFTCIHISQIAWVENKDGFVDAFAWKFQKSAEQAYELWGNKCSDKILACVNDKPDELFEFILWIGPRDKSKVKKEKDGSNALLAPPKERAYESLYIEKGEKVVVDESGYYEFPAHCARWSLRPGEKYGFGQGHIALPDVRSYNKLREENLYAVAKDNNPPTLSNQRDVFGPLNLMPGSNTVVRDINGVKELVSGARTDRTERLEEKLFRSIKSIFFLDQLLLPPREDIGQMREAEVLQRIKQLNTVLGPIALRIKEEFLSPIIKRSFKMLLRSNMLGEIPAVILDQGLNMEVVYVNELENAQNAQVISNNQQLLNQLGVYSQFKPEVLDNFNFDQMSRDDAKALSISESSINSDKEVEETRVQRQQQFAQQAQLEQANLAADTMSKAGPIEGAV